MKIVIDLDKSEVELLLRGLHKMRQHAQASDNGLSAGQARILDRKSSELASRLEDIREEFHGNKDL